MASADQVCVRNYGGAGGMMTCNQFPEMYAFVVPVQPTEIAVCTRIYSSAYCSGVPGTYVTVKDEKGKEICVLNNDQPGVANLCQSAPKQFVYIKRSP